jgi:hypothetical protein
VLGCVQNKAQLCAGAISFAGWMRSRGHATYDLSPVTPFDTVDGFDLIKNMAL